MDFKIGDSVRYKSQKQPMTIKNISKVKSGSTCIYCVFLNDDNKEIIIQIFKPDAIEIIPPKALKRLNKEKNKSGLKNLISNHPIVVYSTIAVAAFVFGITVRGEFLNINGKEIIEKDSYILKNDFNEIIHQNYIDREKYITLSNEYSSVMNDLVKLKSKRIEELLSLLNKTYNELEEFEARSSGFDKSSNIETSVREQKLFNWIEIYNREIEKLQY